MLSPAFEPIRDDLNCMENIIAKRSVCGVEIADVIARHMMASAGKRIRPAVFLLSARIAQKPFSEKHKDNLIEIAAAIELVHTASLLHDDVVDCAGLRRGAATANEKWGNLASVLTGDVMLCMASEMIAKAENQRLTNALIDGARRMAEGELREFAVRKNPKIDEAECLKIIEAKTASIFSAAARLGAIVSGLNSTSEHALSEYGRCVGTAFQLVDDALDYAASIGSLGKSPKSDLLTNTPTYPLISALSKTSDEETFMIERALKSESLDSQTLCDIAAVVERRGGIRSAFNLAKEYSSQAKAHLSEFKTCAEIDSLKAIADYAADWSTDARCRMPDKNI